MQTTKEVPTKRKVGIGPTQQKILLLLATGIALGFSGSPKQYFKIVKACREDWKTINKNSFVSSVKSLHKSGLVTYVGKKRDGVFVHLTKKGEREARRQLLCALTIKEPRKWDRKWRIVAFDIPSGKDDARDALRFHLKQLGFVELQQSVFIHPYPAKRIIEDIADFYEIHQYVTYIRADKIDNEHKLRVYFKL